MKKFLLTAGFLAVVGLAGVAEAAAEQRHLVRAIGAGELSKIDADIPTACRRIVAVAGPFKPTMGTDWPAWAFEQYNNANGVAPAPLHGAGAGAGAGAAPAPAPAVVPVHAPPAPGVPDAVGLWRDEGIVLLPPLPVDAAALGAYEVKNPLALGDFDVLANLRGMISEGRDDPYQFDLNKPLSRTFLIMQDLVTKLVDIPTDLKEPLDASLNQYVPLCNILSVDSSKVFTEVRSVNQLVIKFTHDALRAIKQVLPEEDPQRELALNFCTFYAQRYMGFFQNLSNIVNPILDYTRGIVAPGAMGPTDYAGGGGDRFHCMAFASRDGDRRLKYLNSLEALDKEYKQLLNANPFFQFKKDFAYYNRLSFLTGRRTSIIKGLKPNVYPVLESFVALCDTYARAGGAGDGYDRNAVKKAEAKASATYLQTDVTEQETYLASNRAGMSDVGLKAKTDGIATARAALDRAQAIIRDLEAAEAGAAAEAARRRVEEAGPADRVRLQQEAKTLAENAAAAERARKAAEQEAADRSEREKLKKQEDERRAALTADERRAKERAEETARRAARYAAPSLFKDGRATITLQQIDLLEDVLVLIEQNTNTKGESLVGYKAGEEIMSRGLLAQITPNDLAIIKEEIEKVRSLAGAAKISDVEHNRLRLLIRGLFHDTDPNNYAARISVMSDNLIAPGGSIEHLKGAVAAQAGSVLDRAINLISASKEPETMKETIKLYATLLKIGQLDRIHSKKPEWQAILLSVAAILHDHTDEGRGVKCETGARGRKLQLDLALLNFMDLINYGRAHGGGVAGAGAGAAARPFAAPVVPGYAHAPRPAVPAYDGAGGAGAGGAAPRPAVPAYDGAGGAGAGAAAPGLRGGVAVAVAVPGEQPMPAEIRALGNAYLFDGAWAKYKKAVINAYDFLSTNEALKIKFVEGLRGMNGGNNLQVWCDKIANEMLGE